MKDFETVYEEQKHAVSLKVEAGYSPQVVVEALGDEEHRIPLADFLRDVKGADYFFNPPTGDDKARIKELEDRLEQLENDFIEAIKLLKDARIVVRMINRMSADTPEFAELNRKIIEFISRQRKNNK